MVFRRDNKAGDAFQRQISALRQQLGDGQDEGAAEGTDPGQSPAVQAESTYDSYASGSTADVSGGLGAAVSRAGDYEEYGGYDTPAVPEGGVTGAVVPTAPELPPVPSVDAQTTVIAADAIWKGEITSEGTVHVYGLFEGSIRAKNDVFVADQADVDATINANAVVVAGQLKGTIRCGGRFEALPTGRVTGDVQSPTLVVHEGAVIAGQVRMGAAEPATAENKPTPVVRRAQRGSA